MRIDIKYAIKIAININIEIFNAERWQSTRVFSPDEKTTISRHAADPKIEIIEYIRRDILNAALRNTDNHGRNTSFLKRDDGFVALSPIYDFAPMFLDPEGIPRSSRWEGELEPVIGRPSWGLIAQSLASVVNPDELRSVLLRDAEAVATLPETMKECGVEDQVIDRVAHRCTEIADDLLQIKE